MERTHSKLKNKQDTTSRVTTKYHVLILTTASGSPQHRLPLPLSLPCVIRTCDILPILMLPYRTDEVNDARTSRILCHSEYDQYCCRFVELSFFEVLENA